MHGLTKQVDELFLWRSILKMAVFAEWRFQFIVLKNGNQGNGLVSKTIFVVVIAFCDRYWFFFLLKHRPNATLHTHQETVCFGFCGLLRVILSYGYHRNCRLVFLKNKFSVIKEDHGTFFSCSKRCIILNYCSIWNTCMPYGSHNSFLVSWLMLHLDKF